MYWDKTIETIPRHELERFQLSQLRWSVNQALKAPFYQRTLKKAGIKSADDIKSLADLRRIPFTTKDDLRSSYPCDHLAVDKSEVLRMHSSSGTTGTPTVIYHTKNDLDCWTGLVARSIVATGCGKTDVFQNMMTYGLFTGGLGLHYGAERVGMMVIPVGSGNTRRQLKFMKDFGTTVVHATPSYLLHLQSQLAVEGIARDTLALKKAFIGAEPHSEETRRKIENLWGVDAYNSYGLSEMNGPGVAFECTEKKGMHAWEDSYLIEIVDRNTLEPLADGAEGEIVFTTLRREATPLLRYRTRDLTFIYPDACGCGRTHRRIGRIKARTDDMLIINGVNVFPSQIEECIMKIPEVGTNYMIVVEKEGTLDRIGVEAEIRAEFFTGETVALDALKRTMLERLKAEILVTPGIKLVEPGRLPVSEGKAKRVIDKRPEF